MRFDDGARGEERESTDVAGRPCGIERLESADRLARRQRALVGHANDGPVALHADVDGDLPLGAAHAGFGVDDQVEDRSLQITAVAAHETRVVARIELQRHAGARGGKSPEIDRRLRQVAQLHVGLVLQRRLGERRDVGQSRRRARALAAQPLETTNNRLRQVRLSFEEFHCAGDDQQRVVDFVDHTRQEPARGH